MSLLRIQKPKTRKGKVALLDKEPKVIENIKNALILEGRKVSGMKFKIYQKFML